MMKHILRLAFIGCFWLGTSTAKAQLVITEYFIMSKTFKIDLSSSTAEKKYYLKGVLDITWNDSRLELAVTYDPKKVTIYKAMQHILSQTIGADIKQKKEK